MDPAPSTSTPRVPATPVAPNAIPGANMNDLRSLLAAAGYENAADKPTEAAQQDANHYLRLLQTRQAQRAAGEARDVVERAARWRGPFGDAEAAVLAAARALGRPPVRPAAERRRRWAPLAATPRRGGDLGDAGAPGGGDGGDALDDDGGADARAGCVLAYVGDAALPPGEAPRAPQAPAPTGASLTLSTVDVDAPPPGEGPLDADEPKRKAPAHADRPPAKKAKKQPPPPPAHDDTAEPPPAKAPAAAKKAPKGKQASKKAAPKMAAKAKGKVLAKELPPAHDDDDDDDDDDGEPPTVTRGGRVSRPRGR
ncbi:hypothetical protein SO694_00073044 [Aureococcus anophagefferens]|uniref:Uncharacterized protein n=1 Tax=Aureococcus anophagefferens TaxID=44056 RepID=A0ABR1FI90_AURAN